MGYFDDLISKEGETVSHYVHSWETSRDSTTNLKESKWATAVNITVVVRSQPSFVEERELGLHKIDTILILTKTAVVNLDVIKWNNKYFSVIMVEPIYWKSTIQYYRCTCQERLEFIGN